MKPTNNLCQRHFYISSTLVATDLHFIYPIKWKPRLEKSRFYTSCKILSQFLVGGWDNIVGMMRVHSYTPVTPITRCTQVILNCQPYHKGRSQNCDNRLLQALPFFFFVTFHIYPSPFYPWPYPLLGPLNSCFYTWLGFPLLSILTRYPNLPSFRMSTILINGSWFPYLLHVAESFLRS